MEFRRGLNGLDFRFNLNHSRSRPTVFQVGRRIAMMRRQESLRLIEGLIKAEQAVHTL
jgi:hypothetical protein